MSNHTCEHCGAECIDSPRGYVTGCEHYPADAPEADQRRAAAQRLNHFTDAGGMVGGEGE